MWRAACRGHRLGLERHVQGRQHQRLNFLRGNHRRSRSRLGLGLGAIVRGSLGRLGVHLLMETSAMTSCEAAGGQICACACVRMRARVLRPSVSRVASGCLRQGSGHCGVRGGLIRLRRRLRCGCVGVERFGRGSDGHLRVAVVHSHPRPSPRGRQCRRRRRDPPAVQ